MSVSFSRRRVLLVALSTSRGDLPHTPPLGLMYLAACLRRSQPDAFVDIIDQKITEVTDREIAARCLEGQFGVVGLSLFTPAVMRARRIAGEIHRQGGDAVVVAGGPHVSSFMEDGLAPEFDYGVFGEGEEVFAKLVARLADGQAPDDTSGLLYRRDGAVLAGTPRPPIQPLDGLPQPAWDLIDLRQYWKRDSFGLMGRRPYASVFTSRGCPFRCSYCHSIFGKRFRGRSPENVLAEMEFLASHERVAEFELVDDCFNFDRARALAIFGLIRARLPGVRLLFPNGLRTDLLDAEFIEAMAAAGTYYISVAVESASPRVQSTCGKALNLEKVRKNIELCSKQRIFLNGYFMFGFPGETRAEAEETIAFATGSKLHTASFFFLTPFKGTAVYEHLTAAQKDAMQGNVERMMYDHQSFNLTAMTKTELAAVQRLAFRRFYLRPGLLFRTARAHPRPLHAAVSFAKEMLTKASSQIMDRLVWRKETALP